MGIGDSYHPQPSDGAGGAFGLFHFVVNAAILTDDCIAVVAIIAGVAGSGGGFEGEGGGGDGWFG